MRLPDRQEETVRRMLAVHPAPLPADLVVRAAERGARLRVRRRTLQRWVWAFTACVVTALVLWTLAARPWDAPWAPEFQPVVPDPRAPSYQGR